MDIKLLALTFGTVFLAELGDKTQLATFLFASRSPAALATVFAGACLALVAATAIAVAAGGLLSNYIDQRYISYAAGAAFIVVGIITILRA